MEISRNIGDGLLFKVQVMHSERFLALKGIFLASANVNVCLTGYHFEGLYNETNCIFDTPFVDTGM